MGTWVLINEMWYYQPAFELMERDRVDSLIVSDESEHIPFRAAITKLAAKSRIPAIYPYRLFVEVGGLMAYAIDLVEVQRRCASVIYKILKGDNPGDIPFYQQTQFELTINIKTAKALGLRIPPTLLGRSDEVIE